MKREDYELTKGTFMCQGCVFDKGAECDVSINTPYFDSFCGCWEDYPIIDDGDPEIIHYNIWKKK